MKSASFIVFLVFFFLSGAYYNSALQQAAPKFPPQFGDPLASRQMLDILIWNWPVPRSAARNYVVSLVCATIAFGAITFFCWLDGPLLEVVMFASLFIVGGVVTFRRWTKYRNSSNTEPNHSG
jgi:hypothetical protein